MNYLKLSETKLKMTTNYHTASQRGWELIMLSLLLFIFGLTIPVISKLSMFFLFLIILISGKLFKGLNSGFIMRMTILLFFVTAYFMAMYFHGFIEFHSAVQNMLLIVISYWIGYSISKLLAPHRESGLLWILLSLYGGFVVFSFLSVMKTTSNTPLMLISERAVPSFWTAGDPINGPVLGIYASLGICFAPVTFFGEDKTLRGTHFIFVAALIVLLTILGGFTNIALQNRSPYIALIFSLLVSIAIYYFIRTEPLRYKIAKTFIFLTALGLMAFLSREQIGDFAKETVFMRFEKEGLETGRYESWQLMIENLFSYPLGGRSANIGGWNYVHNLWLDVAYTAGIIPFIFLILFHISHIKSISVIFHRPLPLVLTLLLACIGVSVFVASMVEPIMDASVSYFAASCFFLGLIYRLSLDTRLKVVTNKQTI